MAAMADDLPDTLTEHLERPASTATRSERMQINEQLLQALQEKAAKAQENFEREEKLRKELEGVNAKLAAEKAALLKSLEGEKGSLSEYQEKSAKLQAQKNDLESQLAVSSKLDAPRWQGRGGRLRNGGNIAAGWKHGVAIRRALHLTNP